MQWPPCRRAMPWLSARSPPPAVSSTASGCIGTAPRGPKREVIRLGMTASMPRCCGQICSQQRVGYFGPAVPQAGGMAENGKSPLFSERVREQLLLQRILVLDGVLDDDNGTLLATQLLTLAVEDPAADIALWINSPGGSVPSMLAIRDLMR